jgi:hypothetical protein
MGATATFADEESRQVMAQGAGGVIQQQGLEKNDRRPVLGTFARIASR